MRLSLTLSLLILLAVALFAALNWPLLSTTAPVSLGITTLQAAPGLVLLGALTLLAVLFLIGLLGQQTAALMESRRLGKDVQAARALAEQAELSRYTELREELRREMQALGARQEVMAATLKVRFETLENELGSTLENSGNALAAALGEIDDRLQRRFPELRP